MINKIFLPNSNSKKVYIIAEIGLNHNGNINNAKKLIKAAFEIGADAVKFQLRNLKEIYVDEVLKDSKLAEQSSQYLLNQLRKSHLTPDNIKTLHEYSKKFKLDFLVTPFDESSATFLNKIDIPAFKIGSPDMTNVFLLDHILKFNKPMIVSTGMSEYHEITQVVNHLKSANATFALMHCNSTYPASPQDLNLSLIKRMKKDFGVIVGYSGHERGFIPTLIAVSLGAEIIERHITFDKTQEGPDHRSSLDVDEFRQMVQAIREIELSIGVPQRILGQGEKNNRLALGKSLVFKKNLKAGTILNRNHFTAKTPARGISPFEVFNFIGKKLYCDVKRDLYVSLQHIRAYEKRSGFNIKHLKRWGQIGRLNDFNNFLSINPKIIEINLTWRDLVAHSGKIDNFYSQELVVHAPEYYFDKLVDFTADDSKVIANSLEMLQKTINLTRKIANKFNVTDKKGPAIIVHPGGHFEKVPKSLDKEILYSRLKENLLKVNSAGVRLLVENMPPLPWYFGGKWHNTIFLDADEITRFSKSTGFGICYDVSHAGLYCNYAGIDLIEHARKISRYVKCMHISDARGSSDEGLQIGEGNIDFHKLLSIYKNKNIGFIPEVWQGHLNNGQGFKTALLRLDKIVGDI